MPLTSALALSSIFYHSKYLAGNSIYDGIKNLHLILIKHIPLRVIMHSKSSED